MRWVFVVLLVAACDGAPKLREGRVELARCASRCLRVVTFDDTAVAVRITGAFEDPSAEYADAKGKLTSAGERRVEEELAKLVPALGELPDVSGCPDCGDDPRAALIVEVEGDVRTLSYEFLAPPEPLAGLNAIVREIYTALGLCSTTELATYESGEQACDTP